MSQQVLSISQINEYIRAMMDADPFLSGVAVKGEISNYKVYPSGHHYFTLKDEGSALKCVMFRGNSLRLRFKPENGMKVIAMGNISVYPRDGAYQLYCTAMAMDGVGDLHAAFEQLKAKLSAQGLFDPAHKKPIPKYPHTIGIVTSSAGAAVHDILRVLRKRYPLVKVLLLPVRVQGAEAPGEIVSAIHFANLHKLADLLIVGRGGGSIEDLWAFNDEGVARAIFDSQIPIISAVGHEPDVTISDYVADLRAATPSNAAELAVPDQTGLFQMLDSMSSTISTVLLRQMRDARKHLDALRNSSVIQNPFQYITLHRNGIKLLDTQMQSCQQRIVDIQKQRFAGLVSKLDAMSPLKVLSRGYAMINSENGELVRSVNQIKPKTKINICVSDGTITATVNDVQESAL